jgi:hypothetical protein
MNDSFRKANCSKDYHKVYRYAEEGQNLASQSRPAKIRCGAPVRKPTAANTENVDITGEIRPDHWNSESVELPALESA